MKNKIFVTGNPRVGKTTLVKGIIEELKKDSKRKISGIITPEFKNEQGKREGFFIQDLSSREKEILSSINIKSEHRVGKYFVNIGGIEKILDLFLKSFQDSEICVIDELGAMELKSKKFQDVMEKVLDSEKICLITLHRNLIDEYKNKGEIFWLERENFDEIKEKIIREIES